MGAMLARLVLAMLLVLALLVGGVVLFQRFGRRALKLGGRDRPLRILDRLALGPKKSVCLLSAGGRHLLLGVGEKEITLLMEMSLPQEPAEEDGFAEVFEGVARPGSRASGPPPREEP